MSSVPTVCRLTEYSASSPIIVDEQQRQQLLAATTGRLTILAGPDTGTVVVRSSSFVGSVRVRDLVVEVRPKVPMENLFALFTAGAGLVDWSDELATWEQSDLVAGIAAFVVRAIDEATSRGMLHGYRQVEERVPVIRGRLLVDELARRPWDLAPAPCRYDDFTADTRENRILRATLDELVRWPELDFGTRRRMRRLLERFDGVQVVSRTEALAEWPVRTRLNDHLTVSLALARLVLSNSGINHEHGEEAAHTFLVDMNSLFEQWVAAELARRLSPTIEVREQVPTYFARGRRVLMRPDLVFATAGRVSLVGDTKYKLVDGGLARGSDYYQMLAYTVALQTATGLLIYCSSDDQRDKSVRVQNLDKDLICYQLPLSGRPRDLYNRVDDLAAYVRDLCLQE